MSRQFIALEDVDLFRRAQVIDLSGYPLRLVAENQESIRLSGFWPRELRHPDLWHDGRWVEA